MAKQSWKLRSLGADAGEVVRSSPSQRAAAKRLNIHVSTVSRRIASGDWPAPGQAAPHPAPTAESPVADAKSFAAWAREMFVLSRAEREVVDLGQQALDVARDPSVSLSVRLQAMTQFRACLRDLRLPTESVNYGDVQKTAGSSHAALWPKRKAW